MSLTQAQLAHLAKLTALHSQENLDISTILDSFASLAQVDTSSISQITRSGNQFLSLHDDISRDLQISDELLACSSQKKAAHQIVLGGIMVGE